MWSQTEDQLKLHTLKWKLEKAAVQSSLNVSSSESLALARGTTSFLQRFYAQHSALREIVKHVASLLLGTKHMATAGAVGQTLKSAALYL